MTCAEFDDIAAELALDLISGDERAEAVAHSEGCARCRAALRDLTQAADELVGVAAEAEPPAGFEGRILDRLTPRVDRRRWRRGLTIAGAIAAAVLLVVAVFVSRPTTDGGEREAAMRTPSGANVGDLYVRTGPPTWVFVSVPAWGERWGGRPYTVRVTLADGHVENLDGGDLTKGGWGSVLPSGAPVRQVALVGPDGRVWCEGSLT
jgi:hypothetical protein